MGMWGSRGGNLQEEQWGKAGSKGVCFSLAGAYVIYLLLLGPIVWVANLEGYWSSPEAVSASKYDTRV